ncbi:MAG TPA: hypothetical protein DEA47_04285 [Peptococcaceae bacterium]|nr:MAG: hypothetical protein XD50_1541 [Clostridia bacterium 41_269]HBT20567.1 hypothetical protein [Peptococcaceae bacterium]
MRKYYRDRETGQGRFLLDETLSLVPRQRLSPWTTELAVAAAAEMPYHRAADEVWMAAKSCRERRKLAIKVSVGYEGKTTIGLHRRSLLERRVVTDVADARVFWEQAVAQFGRYLDLSAVEDCYVGGDGAPWVKLGCEYFPRATYRLAPYHLRQALLEGLGHDEAAYKAVCAALAAEEWAEAEKALVAAEQL